MKTIEHLFPNLPNDDGVEIIERKIIDLKGNIALLEKWKWDGIKAESIIVKNEIVSNLSEEEIKKLCSDFLSGKVEIKRLEDYTFISFNYNY